MATIEFTAFPARRPKAAARRRRMRRAGKAPGIVYGGTAEPTPIELDHNALFHALRNEAFHASILTMKLDGEAHEGAAARRADASVPATRSCTSTSSASTRTARST